MVAGIEYHRSRDFPTETFLIAKNLAANCSQAGEALLFAYQQTGADEAQGACFLFGEDQAVGGVQKLCFFAAQIPELLQQKLGVAVFAPGELVVDGEGAALFEGPQGLQDEFTKSKYGDTQLLLQKLKDLGYEKAELLDTANGLILTKKEAGPLCLIGSGLLVGKK